VFPRLLHQLQIRRPLELTGTSQRFNVSVQVRGGGISGWGGAIAHGLARALVRWNSELRPILKQAGLLTRDSRVKERQKYGLKRARKAPQYSKR
jgi:small subunit ribosomal protein S9